jgi:hypothetical protein
VEASLLGMLISTGLGHATFQRMCMRGIAPQNKKKKVSWMLGRSQRYPDSHPEINDFILHGKKRKNVHLKEELDGEISATAVKNRDSIRIPI